jgi:catechol 2,3-dioxygenase-like lactoylglutathione lyase family enzyme
MIDHLTINVSNILSSKQFYQQALAPAGYALLKEFPASVAGKEFAGFGPDGITNFWLIESTPNEPRIHIAFRAENRAQVDAFYDAAIKAGGKDNGGPGVRAHYHANYYGAYVLDPDGHNVEVVCHTE